MEGDNLNIYIANGWCILNKVKCGSLGGNTLKWNKENCIEESKKYTSKKEFKKNSAGAWSSAQRNGWLGEIDYKT